MNLLMRVLVGVLGFLGLLIAARIWLAPDDVGAVLGVAPLGGLGEATIRADLGAFFGATGALALAGAILDRARLLTAPLILVSVALAGRLLTVVLAGFEEDMLQPMVIEAVLFLFLGAGRRFLSFSK